LRPLGKGGLGEVFVALDEELNREVALKEIQQKHQGGADSLVRFLLEAEVTGRLEHPGVVPVYGLGRYADGRPYYAMRLIKGETFKDAIERFHKADVPGRDPGERSLAFRELLRRFIDVCNAVAYAHSKGVLHRDLKPANVMLGPFGETLVIDWGLAKVLGHATADSAEGGSLLQDTQTPPPGGTGLVGTPGYLAPEQAEGRPGELTPASDVYGLGAVLYNVLTGQGAFKGGTMEQVLGRQRRGVLTPPRQVKASAPKALDAVCLKALALQPEDRYGSARELAADVDHWLGDEPVSAYREPLTARWRRWGRRHRSFVSGLAALLVTLTVALGVGLVLVHAEQRKAREAADRAELAEKQLRIELAHTSAGAAVLARQRGQWKDALAHYLKAIELGHEDEVALWLGVLECRLAMYQYRAFREDLERLEARADLGSHRGEVRLMRAMGELARGGKEVDPTVSVHAALEAGDLPPAEKEFALALLAPDFPKAIGHLQEALRHDPFHARALSLLASHLFVSGRMAEFRDTVTRLEMAQPDSAAAIGYRVMVLGLDGHLDDALRLCERLRPLVGDDVTELSRLQARLLARLFREQLLWEANDAEQARLWAEIQKLAPRLGKATGSPDPIAAFGDFAIFRLPCYRPLADNPLLHSAIPETVQALAANPGRAAELATALANTCPNGIYYANQAGFLWRAGRREEACTAMRLALVTPSSLPVDRKARFDLTVMLMERARTAVFHRRWALREEARVHLRELARSGVYPSWAYSRLCSIAAELDEHALALALSEAWQQRYPDDVGAIQARSTAEYHLRAYARQAATLTIRLEKTPGDAELVNQRAVAEYNQGLFANAAASSFEVLKLDPNQPNAPATLTNIETLVRRRQAIYAVLLEKLRLRSALLLAHQGKHAEAVAAVAAEKPAGDTLVALACLYAVASSAAASDASLSPEERTRKSEEYALRSIDLLRDGHAAGYFKDRLRANYLNIERDLNVLRQRQDFKAIVEAINQSPPE
jgi:tetratricopeptide (TPR) repeat protein